MSKLLPISLLASGLALVAPAAHAQVKVSVGPVLGETLAKQHFNDDFKVDYRFGLVAGVQAYLSWGRFALQPALLFSQKGYKYLSQTQLNNDPTLLDLTTKLRLNYLTLPLNFTFAPAGTGTGPQFFAGPYVSMLLGGSLEQNLSGQPDASQPIRIANEADLFDGPTARRFETGIQGGLGFRYESLVLQAAYSLGLSDTSPSYNYIGRTPKAYNRGFQVSVGYLFDVTH